MKISTNYYQNYPNFKAINLSAEELSQSEKLIRKLKNKRASTNEHQTWKRNLFNIFKIHLHDEAKIKTNFFYIKDDVFAELSLMFAEFMNSIQKNDSLEILINKINEFRPSKYSIKPEFLHKSLDVNVSRFNHDLKRVDMVTEENLPTPKSAVDVENDINKLDKIIDDGNLSLVTKNRMKERVRGAKYKEIAAQENVHKTSARRSIRKGILKIQQDWGIIPPEITDKVKDFANILDCSESEILKAALKDIDLLYMDTKILTENIDNSINLLKCTKKEFIKAGLRYPQLLHIKQETILANIQESAKVFQCSQEEYIALGLKEPRLFYSRPETMQQRIKELAKGLDCTEQEIIKLLYKAPILNFHTPQTLINKVKESKKAFQCTKKEFIKTVFKQPQLLYLNKETMMQNITETANLLGIPKEKLIKTALKQPQLFEQNPQTILHNVTESVRLIGCTKQDFIKHALAQPCLFCQKPETNSRKADIANYYRKLKNIPPQNTISQVSDKKLYNPIIGLLIQREELKTFNKSKINVFKFNLENYLKSNPDCQFSFEIPNDKIVDGFIKYVQDTSVNSLGKNVFEFKVIN